MLEGVTVASLQQPGSRRLAPVRRTYMWQQEELLITFNMTAIANPTCTRLVPPVTWLTTSSSTKVKVLHSGTKISGSQFIDGIEEMNRVSLKGSNNDGSRAESAKLGTSNQANPLVVTATSKTNQLGIVEEQEQPEAIPGSSIIEVTVSRNFAENSLTTLRMHGFTRQDIYRMLDKGPWVLAFDITSTLPKLFHGLQMDLRFNQSQAVHIVSHCPYLIAQYARYKGRDVLATFKALLEAGYTKPRLVSGIMRFPSMLASPPERIRGWQTLLECFNVARDPALFGTMLKRAPYMFYVDAPSVHDHDPGDEETVRDNISTTASGYVAYEALRALRLLQDLEFPDLDKLVRTQPTILLVDTKELNLRANFLFNLFLESIPTAPMPTQTQTQTQADANNSEESSQQSVSAAGDSATRAAAAMDIIGALTGDVNVSEEAKLSAATAALASAEATASYSINNSQSGNSGGIGGKWTGGARDRNSYAGFKGTSYGNNRNTSGKRSKYQKATVKASALVASDVKANAAVEYGDNNSEPSSKPSRVSIKVRTMESDYRGPLDGSGGGGERAAAAAAEVLKERQRVDEIVLKDLPGKETYPQSVAAAVADLASESVESSGSPKPQQTPKERAKEQLGALLLTYPAVLSIGYQ
jgi:mTERF